MSLAKPSYIAAPVLATVLTCGGANQEVPTVDMRKAPESMVADLSRNVAEAARCVSEQVGGRYELFIDDARGEVRCVGFNGRKDEIFLSVDPQKVETCMVNMTVADDEFVACVVKASDSVMRIEQDVCERISPVDLDEIATCDDINLARSKLAERLMKTVLGMDNQSGLDGGDYDKKKAIVEASVARLSDEAVLRKYHCDEKGEIREKLSQCHQEKAEKKRAIFMLQNVLGRLLGIHYKMVGR